MLVPLTVIEEMFCLDLAWDTRAEVRGEHEVMEENDSPGQEVWPWRVSTAEVSC